MLLHNKTRFASTVLGVAVAFFLSAAQIGLLVGWCNTTSAVLRHAGADVWVMAQNTSAFDYGMAIPKGRIYQVRSVPGVEWAEGLIMTWVFWRSPDGRNMSIELVGLDQSLRGGPWSMHEGDLEAVRAPDGIIIDHLYRDTLGIHKLGDQAEIMGQRAVLRGVSRNVRTFTAAPWVFCSLESAIKYDPYYKDDEVTYVLARCRSGSTPEQACRAIQEQVPAVEALTTRQFAVRTIKYWMLETGVGITVVITAILGLLVGTVITSQTLYAITQDHLSNYATLLAIGFARRKLVGIILTQASVLAVLGALLGTIAFAFASRASASTPIPIEMVTPVFVGLLVVNLVCCIAASFLSMRSVFNIDPVTVFRG
jgi:putative ABC transport system permease protein